MMGDAGVDLELAFATMCTYAKQLDFLADDYLEKWAAPKSRYQKGVLACATGHIHNFTIEVDNENIQTISADVRSYCRPSVEYRATLTCSSTEVLTYSCACPKAAAAVDNRCKHLISLLVAAEVFRVNYLDRPKHLRFPGFKNLTAQELTDRKLGWRDFTRSMLLPTPPRSIAGALAGGYWAAVADRGRLEGRRAMLSGLDSFYTGSMALEIITKDQLVFILRSLGVQAASAESKETLLGKLRTIADGRSLFLCFANAQPNGSNSTTATASEPGLAATPPEEAPSPERRAAKRSRTRRDTSTGSKQCCG